MERCQYELATNKYFGLPETVKERDKINVDYGLLVDFACAMKNDWIKVSEKEPPKAEPILIFNGHWIGVGYYKKNFALEMENEPDWCDEATEYIEPGATHWMPLPDRPIVSDGSNAV